MELRESQDDAEDAQKKVLAQVKHLEEELVQAKGATAAAQEETSAKEQAAAQREDELEAAHAEELKKAGEAHDALVAELENVKASLAEAQHALADAKTQAAVDAADHVTELQNAEDKYLAKQAELAKENNRITAELDVS